MSDDAARDLVVLRCSGCGDTFTAHAVEGAECPSCGGRDLQMAHEPLL